MILAALQWVSIMSILTMLLMCNCYSCSGGGIDYFSGPYTIQIPAGIRIVPFNISIVNDMLLENIERFVLNIINLPSGIIRGDHYQATVIIFDDDGK